MSVGIELLQSYKKSTTPWVYETGGWRAVGISPIKSSGNINIYLVSSIGYCSTVDA